MIAGTLLVLAGITLIPAVAEVFAFQSLALSAWLGAFLVGLAMSALFELGKMLPLIRSPER